MNRKILHVDVNNAFLSWTATHMLNNGYPIDIRTIPSIIGGDELERSGIVLAKSPTAKEFGIKTADTIYQARLKCPKIKIFPSDFNIYKYYSDKLYNLLLDYTDKIERYSIDECFLDMTNFLMGKTIFDIANEIHFRVKKELGFTVNIGISSNKLLAKMASDFEKPNKIHTLFPNEIKEKMWNLPISDLFMLGKKSVPKLYNMQIRTIGNLANTNKNLLIKKFGKHGLQMWEYANGIDNSIVNYKKEKPKGIGHSITLSENTSDIDKLKTILLDLTQKVCYQLRKHNMKANVVNIELRTKDFIDTSHQKKLPYPTSSTKIIYEKSKELFDEMYKYPTKIRLIGIRVDKLQDNIETQLSLFSTPPDEKQEKLDKTIDKLNDKYGSNFITRGSNI